MNIMDKLSKKDLVRITELIESDNELDNKIGVGLALEKGLTVEELAAWAVSSRIADLSKDSQEAIYINLNMEKYLQHAISNIQKILSN